MKNNFLNFIEEDIATKKTLISTLPLRTKTNKKNYNLKIEEIQEKYIAYKKHLKKYIESKSKSNDIPQEVKNLDKLSEELTNLEHIRFVLNNINTYYEKMGFDSLIYEISNYYNFQFDSLNRIINSFLDKFLLIKVTLSSKDFDYNCYVNEYMNAFLEVRNSNKEDYTEVSKIFEKIYWQDPDLISHIELNFRKLIKKHSSKFNKYISDLQRKLKSENSIKDYKDCMTKLKNKYIELNTKEQENVSDILTLAKAGTIDMADYMNEAKARTQAFSSIALDTIDFSKGDSRDHFYENVFKLKQNLIEYKNYRQFIPLIDDFRKTYEKHLETEVKDTDNKIKEIEKNIGTKEKKLDALNKKIFKSTFKLFGKKSDNKILKQESLNLCKELYNLYKDYDNEYFKSKILHNLGNSLTISDLLNLYYSFDYYKKDSIRRVFDVKSYDELIKLSDEFDIFAMNPTNVVMSGTPLFEYSNVSKIIVNKYRLSKLNIEDEDLDLNNIDTLLEKLELLLRINKIENSNSSVEKLWFVVKSQNIINEENNDKN